MEQRPLRLGDIVDDYCPRERRITNHVIVALIDDRIRQTRCTTCESEHVYKEARVPRRRKKDEAGELVPAGSPAPPAEQPPMHAAPAPLVNDSDAEALPAVEPAVTRSPESDSPQPGGAEESWFGHRRLIRASLPRTDAEPQPRPIPEFTMHQRQFSGNQAFRQRPGGNGNGPNGFRHARPGGGQGNSHNGQGGQGGQGGGRHRGGRGRHRGGGKHSR